MRIFSHILFRPRYNTNKELRRFAANIRNKIILELGTGTDKLSAKRFFHRSNHFIQSDIFPPFEQIDITDFKVNNQYDVILCSNVLEHIYDHKKAIQNIYAALKPKGRLFLFIPMFYPLHDEPYDYYRYTIHALKKLLYKFEICYKKHYGLRKYPFAYCLECVK